MSSPEQELGPSKILPPPAEPDPSQKNELRDNNTTDNSDSDNNDIKSNKNGADSKRRPTLAVRMLNLCKEITIMILIAVAYAALTNETPPKVSKSPAAYPFFPKDSIITDWYRGQITEAIEEARSSDIAFVMFYAPWDAESQTARKQFEIVAKVMHKYIAFSSINCWQPGSECRRQYSKVYKWPVLIAYPTHGRGIQYNGPLEAFHMIKFLQNICKPLIRPHDINQLTSKHDTVITANINVMPGSYHYAVFYSTALRFLEKDPFRDVIFAVIPQQNSSFIHLHVWNGTIIYGDQWNPEALSSWILKNLQQVAGWLSPTGAKSLTLAGFVQPGPTFILFTPKNPLLQEIDYYNMLREIAYDYYNCANNTHITSKQKLIGIERLNNRRNYQKLKKQCLYDRKKNVISNLSNLWTNTSLKDICNCATDVNICRDSDEITDPKSPEFLQKIQQDEECRMFLLSEKYSSAVFEEEADDNLNITGLACQTNRTLAFIALDSLRYYHFADKLGLNLFEMSDKSGAVIINDKMETHHVMSKSLNSRNLRLFVYNFTKGILSRSLRSNLKTKINRNCPKFDEFCIIELTSDNFLDAIKQPNKVVVVFYYSKQCSFCNGIAYKFLSVAKILSPIDDVVFTRIDGDRNLLPWEYTMETYPTILLFPAKRKSESRALPKNIPITVPNLIGFILTNVEPGLKLKAMWAICNQAKFEDDKVQCIASVRTTTLAIIDKTLREWRNANVRRKQQVLYKLQILRHLHLLFAHSPNKILQIKNYLNKIKD